MHRRSFLHPLFLGLLPTVLCAAETRPVLHLVGEGRGDGVVVRGRLGDAQTAPVMVAVWQDTPHGKAVFHLELATPNDDVRLMLDRLAEAAVMTYLDTRIRFTKQGVVTDRTAESMAAELDEMVLAAANELGGGHGFTGFSEPTRRQLDRLVHIDWSRASMAVDAGAGQDKYLAIYYYLKSQRTELDRQLRADLLPLADIAVLGAASADTEVHIGSVCGAVFDDQNYLCALDLQVTTPIDVAPDPLLARNILAPAEAADPRRIRKRDRWLKAELDGIHQRIDGLDQRRELWELRDRVEDMEDRMAGLELEVQANEQAEEGENPLAELSHLSGRNLTVRFSRNSVEVSLENAALLSEVVDQLLRSPDERVLITGYSDRSGDPALNMRLSERRAKAVRDHLLRHGVEPERLLINYFGDSRSAGRDPSERRVEVEWVRMR